MKTMICLFLSFVSVVCKAEGAGFKEGNNISIITLEGNVEVRCNSYGPGVRRYYCSDFIANPGVRDYFVIDTPVDADRVKLIASHLDGSKTTKSDKFNSAIGSSKGEFNLLIRSLLQTPLLNLGLNSIEYKLTKGKNEILTGVFDVTVDVTEQRECRPGFIFGNGNVECDNIALACDRYFDQENNCKYN